MDRENVLTMDQALERMRGLTRYAGDWVDLAAWLPAAWCDAPRRRRSAAASHFAAALQLAKEGALDLRQDTAFAPIRVRARG
jgi:segregation and condensation protein A